MKYTDVLLGRYLSNCSGGGGGDYNSLTMTAIGDGGQLYVYAISSGDYYSCIFATEDGFSYYVGPVNSGEEKAITVLYNGDSVSVNIPPDVTEVSGNATYDSETETLTATGDFTIKGHYVD